MEWAVSNIEGDGVVHSALNASVHLVVLDERVPEGHTLLSALPAHTQVLVQPAHVSMLSHLRDWLQTQGVQALAGIHLVGHGEPGRLLMGNAWLDATSINADFEHWYELTQHFHDDAQCWVYGCQTGQGSAGHTFINALADALCVHVHAASHMVGAREHGGSWTLDRCTAPYLAIHNPVAAAWKHTDWGYVLMADNTALTAYPCSALHCIV